MKNLNTELDAEDRQTIINSAAKKYGEFLSVLGFDWENDSNMSNTPQRVAKCWVAELARGCYTPLPNITAFNNVDHYDGVVFQGNIRVTSLCAHHCLPFFGHAYIAYIPQASGKVIGLSKLNRIVDYFSRRPQVQENLTMQIHGVVNHYCSDNLGVAVHISAVHTCVKLRGVEHDSVMKTSKLSGAFLDRTDLAQSEFYNFIADSQKRQSTF